MYNLSRSFLALAVLLTLGQAWAQPDPATWWWTPPKEAVVSQVPEKHSAEPLPAKSGSVSGPWQRVLPLSSLSASLLIGLALYSRFSQKQRLPLASRSAELPKGP